VRARWLIVAGIFVVALVWLWHSTKEAPEAVQPTVEETRQPAPQPTRSPMIAPKPRVVMPAKASTFDATSTHTADPCTELVEAVIPPGFESVSVIGITVAWDPTEVAGAYDTPFRPISLATLTAGILEEAAQLTGTDRRQTLAVIVDASTEDLQKRTHAPSWVGGLYDGGAVHVPAKLNADAGVLMSTLRHEVMHAQIHAGVGCVPFWFNEGVANYFAGSAHTHEWFQMMRGEVNDIPTLDRPAIFDVKAVEASRMYAVAETLVLYIVHHGGDQALRTAIQVAKTTETGELWSRVAPGIDYHAVLDSLAQKVFGMPMGPELDTLLRSPMCCRNLRVPAELSCRAEAVGTGRREVCRRW
jgi:hypothetical protein